MNYYKQNYLVKLFKILGNAKRLKILQALENSQKTPISVNDLAEKLGLPQANLSTHLVRMRENGILKAKQSGLNMFYSIKDENAMKLVKLLEKN